MRRAAGAALILVLVGQAMAAHAVTEASLSGRVVIDGYASEYTADEWILDTTTDPAESDADSRWGRNNDVRRIAVTWDLDHIYIVVDATAFDSSVMAFLAYAGGGIQDMSAAGPMSRAISFPGAAPNLLATTDAAGTPLVARTDATRAFGLLAETDVPRRFAEVLEMRVPWEVVRTAAGTVDVLAAVSGDAGSGAGDGAPDPSSSLSAERYARAVLDRWMRLVVDADGDGQADIGVEPRAVARVVPNGVATTVSDPTLDIALSARAFAPDRSESVSFRIHRAAEDKPAPQVFVTCRVYDISGRLIHVLYEDDPRDFDVAEPPPDPRDQWDGTDSGGAIVPGGVYVINVTWGESRGARTGSSNASVAVVR